MLPKLCIFVCQNFYQEVVAAIAAEAWPDVVAVPFASRCGRPPLNLDELTPLLPSGCTQAVVVGRACLAGVKVPATDSPRVGLHVLEQCFHWVAAPGLVEAALHDGAYQITPAWLADWRGHLGELGFGAQAAGEFFQDFARELVLFDTGIDPQATTHLAALSHAVGLPAQRLAVGLGYTRLVLTRIVLEWRLDDAQRSSQARDRQHAQALADHVVALDLLAQLARSQQEAQVEAAIEELFCMLFAPVTCCYVRAQGGRPVATAPALPADLLADLPPLDVPWAWTPSGLGFMLCIAHGGHLLGHVVVEGLAFPQFRERYLNLALAMVGVCALAIDEVRAKAELKQLNEQLTQSQRQVLQSEKMAAVGQLAAGVAHEINNPIGFVSSNLRTLKNYVAQLFLVIDAYEQGAGDHSAQGVARLAAVREQADLDFLREDVADLLAESRDGLHRVSKIVQDLRDFSRIDSPQWAAADLNNGLESTLNVAWPGLKNRVDVVKRYGPLPLVRCQAGQINQVFMNLLVNAGQAIQEQGQITLSSGSDGPWAWVQIEDTGHGMSTEVQSRIFEPFFTTHPVGQGTGLGLSLAYDIVKKHQGRIEVSSAPGQGARFQVWLPVAGPAGAEP